MFWHRPRAGVDAAEYVAALSAFHERIGVPSWFAALERPPWGEDVGWYEDWYLVEDWNGLGRLNEVAITGARQPPHDVAAALAREGIAGIYGLIGGRPEPPEWAAWVTKPQGTGYADFEQELVAVARRRLGVEAADDPRPDAGVRRAGAAAPGAALADGGDEPGLTFRYHWY